jgi:hypothetical protein
MVLSLCLNAGVAIRHEYLGMARLPRKRQA